MLDGNILMFMYVGEEYKSEQNLNKNGTYNMFKRAKFRSSNLVSKHILISKQGWEIKFVLAHLQQDPYTTLRAG